MKPAIENTAIPHTRSGWKLPDNIEGLAVCYEAQVIASDSMLGLHNQPRGQGVCELEDWMDALGWRADDAIKALEAMNPATTHEAEAKLGALLDWYIRCGTDEPQRLLEIAVAAAKERSEIIRRELAA
jgi:hypothetical protein